MSVRSRFKAQTLDDTITLQRQVAVNTGTGGRAAAWSPLVSCRARVDGAKANSPEPVLGDGVRTKRGYTVWVRSDVVTRFRITPKDRVVWRTNGIERTMNILDIPDQGLRGRMMALLCEAGLVSG